MPSIQDLVTIQRLIKLFEKQLYAELYNRKRQTYIDWCAFQKHCFTNWLNLWDPNNYQSNKELFHISILRKLKELITLYDVAPTDFNNWCSSTFDTLYDKLYAFYTNNGNNTKVLQKLQAIHDNTDPW